MDVCINLDMIGKIGKDYCYATHRPSTAHSTLHLLPLNNFHSNKEIRAIMKTSQHLKGQHER
eukprot:4756584-Prorocentrum_lima.AAC.1